MKRFQYAFAALVLFTVAFFGGWAGAWSYQRSSNTAGTAEHAKLLSTSSNAISEIAKKVGPSVVSVSVKTKSASLQPYSYFFGYNTGAESQQSAGTGIILNKAGLILTNRHVVPVGTTAVSVTLSDGTTLDDVSVVGRTTSRDSLDIAFLKINDLKGQTLTPATLGDSSAMKVGDTVVAIGNTLGQFQNTVTSGIISGYGRSIEAGSGGAQTETLDDLFQTDAAINEGNSGGPLVNLAGEVIGINTAIASSSQNVGFAIPINNVKGLVGSVESTGKLERPYLGVVYVMLTDDVAAEYKLSVKRGAYIPAPEQLGGEAVISGGPAEKAGIKAGDVITKINADSITDKSSLVSILGKHKPGDVVSVTVVRGGDTSTLSATLEAIPQE